jgi:4-amino-4-deoxy-L-arabinose transferase-like glycosyltransferase
MESASLGAAPRAVLARVRLPTATAWLLAICGVTALAAGLRFADLAHVLGNPFYDAAVRSMSQSWHNFFFGAFEPGGRIAIDKPPVDLWLQVASVKLFGWNAIALRLPEALAGTACVPLLYDIVRRVFGRPAGLAAALAMAVLPVAVLTARSDTMDSLMVALLLGALWLAVRAIQTQRARFLYLAALTIGLAFNVKLFEAFLPLGAFGLLYLVAARQPWGRRIEHLIVALLLVVAMSLSWATAVSLSPAHDRPFPVGSTNGSVWNVILIWNGLDRISPQASLHPSLAKHHAKHPHNANHTHSDPASPTRLFGAGGPHYGRAIGSELLPALLLGAVALVLALLAWLHKGRWERPDGARRLRRGLVLCLGIWMLIGFVLFSDVTRLHLRYLESFTPAVAGVLGIAVVALVLRARDSAPAGAALVGGVAVTAAYASGLGGGAWRQLAVVAGAAAVGAAIAQTLVRRRRPLITPIVAAALAVLALVSLLAAPAGESLAIVSGHRSDSGRPGWMPPAEVTKLSAYLQRHTRANHYEFATPTASTAGPLIVHDGRPVLVLERIDHKALVSLRALKHAVRHKRVRYVLMGKPCRTHKSGKSFSRIATRRWICETGKDVSRKAGLHHRGVLFRLR